MKRFFLIGALVLAGCSGETAEGEWQSTETVLGQRNTLVADETGEARSTLFIDLMENGERVAGRFEFEALWLEDSSRSEFDMRCTRSPFGECDGDDDFQMDCRLEQEGTTMTCDGDNHWSEYAFSWSRPSS